MDDKKAIEEGVIDQVEKVVKRAKEELEKVQCPEHGQALKSLDFDREQGRFKIDTCCEKGEKLVNEAIEQLN